MAGIVAAKKNTKSRKKRLTLISESRKSSRVNQPHEQMTTNQTTTIRLRNTITGLYYVEGKNFSGTESEASVYEMNSPAHLVIAHTFDNVQAILVAEITDRDDVCECVSGISNEGAESLKRSVKNWADRLPFAVAYSFDWHGESGPSFKIKATADVPRSQWRNWIKSTQSLGRIINRVKRVHPRVK